MDTIDSPPPSSEVELNWVNLFYAAEWVVFAGFAIFLWYPTGEGCLGAANRRKRPSATATERPN